MTLYTFVMNLDEILKNHVIIIVNHTSKKIINRHVYVTGMKDTKSEEEYQNIIIDLIKETDRSELLVLELNNSDYSNLSSLDHNDYLQYFYFCEIHDDYENYLNFIIDRINKFIKQNKINKK